MTDITSQIARILPPAALREVAPAYLEEPRGRWHGQALAVVAPATTDEVAALLRLCSGTGTPVIPYGGGTGLVGGQLAETGPAPLILSLERMKAVRAFDTEAGTMTVEAGAILSDITRWPRARTGSFPSRWPPRAPRGWAGCWPRMRAG